MVAFDKKRLKIKQIRINKNENIIHLVLITKMILELFIKHFLLVFVSTLAE